jgi:CheY-like chemotaxis protein
LNAPLPDPDLAGRRVFVVEDEALVSILVETILEDIGCQVAGPYMRVSEAQAALDGETGVLDAALLDVNVAGQTVFPVAEALIARGVPVVFATGYGEAGVPAGLRDWPTLQKPYTAADVEAALKAAVGLSAQV